MKVTTVERDVLVAHSCRRLLVVRGPQLERGVKQRVPNALTLAALARALRVGMDELWNGERQEMTA